MIPVWWWWCSFIFFFNTPRTKEVFFFFCTCWCRGRHTQAGGRSPLLLLLLWFLFFITFSLLFHLRLVYPFSSSSQKKGFDFTTISYSCPLFKHK